MFFPLDVSITRLYIQTANFGGKLIHALRGSPGNQKSI